MNLDTPPAAYQDLDEDTDDEEGDPRGVSVFDIHIHLAVQSDLDDLEVKPDGYPQRKKGKLIFKAANGTSFKVRFHDCTYMFIRSPVILKALKETIKYCPKDRPGATSIDHTLREPYYLLLQNKEQISRYVQESVKTAEGEEEIAKAKRLQADYQVLHDFVYSKWIKKIEKELSRYQQDPPVATCEMLWMLLKPGTRVFSTEDPKSMSQGRAGFIVRSIKTNHGRYKLSLWRLIFDGEFKFIQLAAAFLIIWRFDGT